MKNICILIFLVAPVHPLKAQALQTRQSLEPYRHLGYVDADGKEWLGEFPLHLPATGRLFKHDFRYLP
jgi:hypothetical protein